MNLSSRPFFGPLPFLAAWLVFAAGIQGLGAAAAASSAGAAEIRTPQAPPTPRINGPRIYGERPNHPFIYRIPATGDRPMTFSAAGLPPGLTVDASTGLITGAVAQAGTYLATLEADNALGHNQAPLKIVIGPTIGLTPPLGFNTWNYFNGGINDKIIRGVADAMVKSGLADHGWSYINLDDCWMRRPVGAHRNPGDIEPTVGPDGAMLPNLWRFPDMKSLADYVHDKGLKFGIYSSPGFRTCGWSTGSLGHEDQDVKEFADWGVDYLKYDWCSYGYTADYLRAQDSLPYLGADDAKALDQASRAMYALIQAQHEETADSTRPQINALYDKINALESKVPSDVERELTLKYKKVPYAKMASSLNQVNRDIFYSFCQYGDGDSWKWAAGLGANSWRTTGDIQDNWASMSEQGFVKQTGLEQYAGPGHWNDPDMLEIGNGGLTPDEEYTHMTLWCMLAAPLLIGCDMTSMSDFTTSLFSNDEVLAVDQDELGRQGHLACKDVNHQVWIKPLADGSLAVALFNLGTTPDAVTVTWTQIGLTGPHAVRDLWRQKDLGLLQTGLSKPVAPHGAELFRVK